MSRATSKVLLVLENDACAEEGIIFLLEDECAKGSKIFVVDQSGLSPD